MKNPEYIVIGTILSPWGVNGQLKVDVETDFPERFTPSSRVYIGRKPAVIESVDWHKGRAIVKLDSVNNTEQAEKLRNQHIEIRHKQLFTLSEGQYYHFQLIGLEVKTTGEERIGRITEILPMASADIYVVEGKEGEILIPATDEVIKTVEPEKGYVIIEPVNGLLDLNRKKAK